MNAPSRPRPSIFLLALFASTLGTCGTCEGVSSYSDAPYVVAPTEASADEAETIQELQHVLHSDPRRRALGIARVLLGLMLLAGGVMLIMRAKNALWWLQNVLAANIVWMGGSALSQFLHIRASEDMLLGIIANSPTPDDFSVEQLTIGIVTGGALRAAVLIYVLWRLGDVKASLQKEAK